MASKEHYILPLIRPREPCFMPRGKFRFDVPVEYFVSQDSNDLKNIFLR